MSEWEIVRHTVAIAGRVTDAQTHKAIGSALVTISDGPRAFTAPDGHFHFLDLAPGDYMLVASLPGVGARYGQSDEVTVTVSHDTQGSLVLATADLALLPTTLKGRVTNQKGEPVAMAKVRVQGSGERTFSNTEGQYILTGLEVGSRTLRVSAQGYWEALQPVQLGQAGQEQRQDISPTPATRPKPEPPPKPETAEFTPTQLAGCRLWLVAEAIAGPSDGDPVARWPDGSSDGHDVAQEEERKRPTYRMDAIGGRPAVEFDGADDFLTLSFSEPSTNHTFFFVCDQKSLGGHCNFLFDAQTGRLSLDGAEMNPPHNLRWQDRTWREVAKTVTGLQILTWVFSGRMGHVFRNGISLGTDTYTPRSLGGKMALGANYSGRYSRFDGMMAEVIYYNRALTPDELQQVEQYLSNRFGISLGS